MKRAISLLLVIVMTTIRCREVIKRLAAYQLHRNLTSPWVSPGCPHCVIPAVQGLWLDRSIIIPVAFIAVSGATRYLQANSSRSYRPDLTDK